MYVTGAKRGKIHVLRSRLVSVLKAWVSFTNQGSQQSETNAVLDYFWHSIERLAIAV